MGNYYVKYKSHFKAQIIYFKIGICLWFQMITALIHNILLMSRCQWSRDMVNFNQQTEVNYFLSSKFNCKKPSFRNCSILWRLMKVLYLTTSDTLMQNTDIGLHNALCKQLGKMKSNVDWVFLLHCFSYRIIWQKVWSFSFCWLCSDLKYKCRYVLLKIQDLKKKKSRFIILFSECLFF